MHKYIFLCVVSLFLKSTGLTDVQLMYNDMCTL